MKSQADISQQNTSKAVANNVLQQQSVQETLLTDDDRQSVPNHIMKLRDAADNSPHSIQLRAIQEMASNSPQVQQSAQLQAIADNSASPQSKIVQRKKNNTGLPENLKSGVENLSGYSLDDVKVHYNSSKPAALQAHAYAQGTDIHLAPGQEKHLPHEAWHVVQQKQGRVKATMQMKPGPGINDDGGLENEANAMGSLVLEKANDLNLTRNAPFRLTDQGTDSVGPAQLMSKFTPEALKLNNQLEQAKSSKKKDDYIRQLEAKAKEANVVQQQQDDSENTAAASSGSRDSSGIVLDAQTETGLMKTAMERNGGEMQGGLFLFNRKGGYHISIDRSLNFHITKEGETAEKNVHVYWSDKKEFKDNSQIVHELVEEALAKIKRIKEEYERLKMIEQKKEQAQRQSKADAEATKMQTENSKAMAEKLGLNAQNFAKLLSEAQARGWNVEEIDSARDEFRTGNSSEILQLKKNKIDL